MAKFRPAGSRKAKPGSKRGLIPCLFLVLAGFALIFLLLYGALKSGG